MRSDRNNSWFPVMVRWVALFAVWSVAASDSSLGEDLSQVYGVENVVAVDTFDYPLGALRQADGGVGWAKPWQTSRVAPAVVIAWPVASKKTSMRTPHSLLIQGTGARNNPARRALKHPVSQKEVFVRFDLRYQADPANGSQQVDPEFFVLWLDRLDGGDGATHASNVPNIGVHLADRGPKKGKNVFMVRIGPAQTAWSKIELQADRTYQILGRLTKTSDGPRAEYDRFDMWVDPTATDIDSPDATVSGAQSISVIQWIGFATGVKTEPTDRIQVHNVMLGNTWDSVLGESATMLATSDVAQHNGIVWDKPVDFKRDVYPLLKARCFECHSGAKPDSGYRLDVHREFFGYSSGEVLVEPGRSRYSRLIEVISAPSEEDRMPPDGAEPLSDEQIAMLRAWIDQGLKWDDELLPAPKVESDHWAFQPIARVEVPKVQDSAWVRTPVDAFIAQTHFEARLQRADEATPHTLVRRLYLDLIGLPPTPEEVQAFVGDASPDAYKQLVERLLESPHYGERWGRYWLDLARWAESQGYQHDFVRPYAWRYRDYVISSFNKDKPYNQFLKEQLAGDELQPYSDENLIATGFLAAARISGNQEDDNIQRNDVLIDIVNATGSVMLGLTLECAQCHNHKFDPISQRDYYSLQAFFVNGQLGNLSLRESGVSNPTDIERWIPKPAYDFYSKEVKSLVGKRLFEPTKEPHTWGYLSATTGDPEIKRYPVVNRRPIPWQPEMLKHAEARMLVRGDVASPGPVVREGWPEVLGATPSSLGDKSRSALAEWMADPYNPLVARVWVNRLWQYHFGRGIVETASDFGVEGASPTHPELLDWLATELIDHDWSTKHIHRQIVLSNTYRQERKHNEASAEIDPDNKLLWCWPRRRLSAESIRDSVLVATGELDRTIGGVSVPPETEEQQLRRTIYLFQQRSSMPSVMEMFDAPTGIASCSRRSVSTVALQPLFMLNSQFMARRATALAAVVAEVAGSDADRQIEVAFQRTLARQPDADELAMARRILGSEEESNTSTQDDAAASRLMQLCHALLNLNEFVYIP
ncbi:MAG TPA: PSD1 and planctomycete cytochrome C domain-containing protein [Pirellulaceae bacterium]|nr:PSD1 and planctomycete cytochrome C domain-containing protein [Pirellulaceae bacterium]